MLIDPTEAVAHLGVAGEESRDVAEVGRSLQGARRGLDVGRLEAGGLELLQQPVQGEGKAGSTSRASQRPEAIPRLRDRQRDRAQPLGRSQLPDGGRTGSRRHRAKEAAERHHGGAEDRAAFA